MGKKYYKTLGLLLLLVFTSCKDEQSTSKNKQSDSSATSSLVAATNSESNEETTITTSEIMVSSTEEVSTGRESSLRTEEKYFHSNSYAYGTTNGNANNNGKVVFDRDNQKHYFSVANKVYAFDPQSNETHPLFSYVGEGHLQNLCLLDDDLYFVATATNFLYRYSLADDVVQVVYEEETEKVYGYSRTVFANIKRPNYLGEMTFGLATYNHSKKETTTKFNLGTTLVNINGTKLFYNESYGLTLKLMADAFNGKTNIFSFPDDIFTEMTALQLFDVSIDALQVLRFAVLLEGGTSTGLYLYSTKDNSLLKISELPNIQSVNSDGEYIYFISEDNLYRYDVSSAMLEEPVYLYQNAHYLFVINHWLYFSNSGLTELYRMDPVTKAVTTEFWL